MVCHATSALGQPTPAPLLHRTVSNATSSFLVLGGRGSLAASFDSLQVGCLDLASDTNYPPFSIEKHCVLPPTLYRSYTLFQSFCFIPILPR